MQCRINAAARQVRPYSTGVVHSAAARPAADPGPRPPRYLATRHNIALWTGKAGEAGPARHLFAALLPDVTRVLGADHPETLKARGGVAGWTGEGDPGWTRDLFAALLPDVTRVLGPEHPETLRARASHARWTGQAGEVGQARDLFAALLPDVKRLLGPDHPDTLTDAPT
jgi:tetratricopeptide repeat protein